MLYQVGSSDAIRVSDAILQLEDLEVALRGYAEVHAALAVILYVERPARLQQAEQQASSSGQPGRRKGRRGRACARLPDAPGQLACRSGVSADIAAHAPPRFPLLQWEIAMEFNKSFSDRDWVYRTKHWPPRLMAALDRFLTLT